MPWGLEGGRGREEDKGGEDEEDEDGAELTVDDDPDALRTGQLRGGVVDVRTFSRVLCWATVAPSICLGLMVGDEAAGVLGGAEEAAWGG